MRVKLPPTKEKRWYSIRLNRHEQHWSNEFFIAEHSEMIKIFQFQKNHKEIQYYSTSAVGLKCHHKL